MTIDEIRNALQIVDGTLTVSTATLASTGITALLDSYIPNQTLVLTQANIRSQPGDDFVLITGKAELLAVEADVSAKFYLNNDQIELELTAIPPPTWTFSTSFVSLTGHYFDDFASQNVTFVFISHSTDNYRRGLNFTADFHPPAAWDLLLWFASLGAAPTLSGPIMLEQGQPVMTLTVNPVIRTSFGGYLDLQLTLQNLSRVWSNPRDPEKPIVTTQSQLLGQVSFTHNGQQVDLPILASFSTHLSVLKFDLNTEQIFDVGLSEIVHLLNGIDLGTQGLPDYFRPLAGLTLHNICFAIGLRTKIVEYITVAICSTTNWVVIENVIEVEQIAIDFMVLKPTISPDVIVTLNGRINLAGIELDVFAQVPDFQISGQLVEGTSPDLIPLLEHQLGSAQGAPDTLKIAALQFSAHPSGSTYSFDIDVEGHWQIISGLALEGIEVSMAYESYSGISEISGYIRALFGIGNVDISIAAEYSNESRGWQFKGGTGPGQAISIGELLSELGRLFGDIPIPTAIRDGLILENIALSFNTKSKDFFFTCEGQLDLHPAQPADDEDAPWIDAILTIDLKHQADGAFTKHFGGSLTVGGRQFALIFETTKEATGASAQTFVAAYHDSTGARIALDEFLKGLVADFPATGLSFSLQNALLAYHGATPSTPAGDPSLTPVTSSSKWLFGLEIAGGIDLAALNLPDLPLVGAALPLDQTLKLAFQILYASQAFTLEELAAINALNREGLQLPNKAIAAIELATTLQVGQERKQLALPLGLNTSPTDAGQQQSDSSPAVKPDQLPATPASAAAVTGADGIQWLQIQRAFGPVHMERVGIRYRDQQITALLDAALSVAGLTLSLDGLGVTSPLDLDPTQLQFQLQGLGLDFRRGPLEIGGALLRQEMTAGKVRYTGYAGLATIRSGAFSLSALGAYAKLEGHASFFLYAVLSYPLGGPAFFFVTGLAAGLGYNRTLITPTIDQVASFPLVAEATKDDTPRRLPTDRQAQQNMLTAELEKLNIYIPPGVGDYFVAVGIKFTSFKLINSFALLVVKFGSRFEIDVLGLATLLLPPQLPGKSDAALLPPLAEAQLALKATFVPADGFLGVQAQLTAASFILDHNCHLTGGFAFYGWFLGAHAGDFVLTLGGYHPHFQPPAHYPTVPRLGLNWRVDEHLSLKAQAYCALTPHALMAGGNLEAIWQSGDISAWFKADVDFLLNWLPYTYDAHAYVDMNVEATIHTFGTQHLSFNAGADLHLCGPEFAGEAHVNVKVIGIQVAFDVAFGASAPLAAPVDWETFRASFLPAADQICSIAVQRGLVREIEEGETTRWILNAQELVLVTNSAIPITKSDHGLGDATTQIGVAPVGLTAGQVSTTHTITITRDGSAENDNGDFQFCAIKKPAPTALWGTAQMENGKLKPPALNGDAFVEDTVAGFTIQPANLPEEGSTTTVDPAQLRYATEVVADAFTWQCFSLSDQQGEEAWRAAETTVAANENRDRLLQALGLTSALIDFGQPVGEDMLVAFGE